MNLSDGMVKCAKKLAQETDLEDKIAAIINKEEGIGFYWKESWFNGKHAIFKAGVTGDVVPVKSLVEWFVTDDNHVKLEIETDPEVEIMITVDMNKVNGAI